MRVVPEPGKVVEEVPEAVTGPTGELLGPGEVVDDTEDEPVLGGADTKVEGV